MTSTPSSDATAPSSSRAGRSLILVPADCELNAAGQEDVMTWAEAQMTGQHKFSRYDRIVCLPPTYPTTQREPEREGMFLRLRRRLEQGALVGFLYPPLLGASTDDGHGPSLGEDVTCWLSDEWRHSMHLIRSVVGAVLSPREDASLLEHRVADSCPGRIGKWLAKTPSDSVFDVTRDSKPVPLGADDTVVLAGFEAIRELPSALVGFLDGGGAWLAAPCGSDPTQGERLAELLGLVDALEQLRPAASTAEAPVGFLRLPKGTRWSELSLSFTDNHTLRARLKGPNGKSWAVSYRDLGLEDARNKKPTRQWELLEALAEGNGALQSKGQPAHRVRRLRKALKVYFGIPGEPIELQVGGRAWIAAFSIRR